MPTPQPLLLPTISPVFTSPLGARPTRTHQSPWQLSWLLAAPHRLAFFAASLVLSGSALWWAAVLLGRSLAWVPHWTVAPPTAHSLLMTFGFMPLFFVGFMFTAGPRWLDAPDVPARILVLPVALMVWGWALTLAGFHLHHLLSAAGVAVVAGAWSTLCFFFNRMVWRSRAPDRVHAVLVALACTVGALTLWLAALGLALNDALWIRSAVQIALWCFIATMFSVVSHRMLPFFSANALHFVAAWRPFWLLGGLLGMLWLQAPLALGEIWMWPFPNELRWAQAGSEAGASLLLLWVAVRWGLVQSMKIRLLAMLHTGFVWLGLALGLAAISHAMMALTEGNDSLGLAPTHALTMGYFGGTLLAMVTRVSSGHSGRAVAADGPVWFLHWLLHTAVVLRVSAAIWPSQSVALTLLAVAAWTSVCVGWSIRYGNWFGRIRADGRPG